MNKISYGASVLWKSFVKASVSTIDKKIKDDMIELSEKKSFLSDEVSQIKINSCSNNVRFICSRDNEITVELTGHVNSKLADNFILDTEINDKQLNISLRSKKTSHIGIIIDLSILKITAPKKHFDSIVIDTSSADLDIEDISASTVTLKSHSGDINAKRILVNHTFSIETSSGDIDMMNTKSNTLNINSSSGDIRAQHLSSKLTNAKTSSGDIKILTEKLNGKTTVDSNSGDVSIITEDQPESLKVDFKGSSGETNIKLQGLTYEKNKRNAVVGTIGSGEHELIVRTSSGDFSLK
ncbi:DUF4097 family beta strand repeat-containing protein [Cytobacillus sp. IB215665]|uniref:DUF4097 family beta strand repeat-containing protein n=1 Tax=Cytobacillus sp. IB215665 TaxID=3097357 RepID=UPI002A0F45F7|nr:DUF4097 family beta strand repeat-containing protein [Cytobacillus sp. IB215665]MDX8365408.1 DUF4097 family beta strand repeat-containing protein [Cytobacillus sp. IB215665]